MRFRIAEQEFLGLPEKIALICFSSKYSRKLNKCVPKKRLEVHNALLIAIVWEKN